MSTPQEDSKVVDCETMEAMRSKCEILTTLIFGEKRSPDETIPESLRRFLDHPTRGHGRVLLFYNYVDVKSPDELKTWQFALCKALKLKGRVHVGKEGINGTVASKTEFATELYELAMREHKRWGVLFRDTDFKVSGYGTTSKVFSSLFVRRCKEIISIGRTPDDVSWKDSASHLTPREFHRALLEKEKEKVVLIDCRNLYESAIGKFDGAVRCKTRHFSEFPDAADEMIRDLALDEKDTKVLMYCTGGIRCERASAYLRSKGVKRCFQLKGGIARYCETFNGQDSLFRGRNFVFDRRIATDRVGDVTIGRCVVCDETWDRYDTKYACRTCGALVLVCATCRNLHIFDKEDDDAAAAPRKRRRTSEETTPPPSSVTRVIRLVCEYCTSHSKQES